jgi:hypothetical protein
MDLALSRLSQGTCRDTLSDSSHFALLRGDGSQQLTPDNHAWRQLISQLTPVVAPSIMAPVTSGGPAGFDVALETNVTRINDKANYWARGSEGRGSDAVDTCDGRNRNVSPTLTSNRLHFSKGLPLGFTIGATVGRVYNTNLWLVGADIKLALLEGLRSKPVPDAAVRVAVNTTTGNVSYSLTTLALDFVLSKNIVTARTLQLAPYAGAGMLFSFASSGTTDLTPNIDSSNCAAGKDPVCNAHGLGASQADIGHDRPFKDLTLRRYRGFAGLSLRYKLFTLAAEVVFDLVTPEKADKAAGSGLPRQWTLNVAPGLSF